MDPNLNEKIRESREKMGRDLKESTIKTYVKNIKNLSRFLSDKEPAEEQGGVEWLKDVDEVKQKIEDLKYNDTTKRNYYNSIIIYLQSISEDGDNTDMISKYTKIRDEINKIYEESNASSVWSDKQLKNLITAEEFYKMIADIGRELKAKQLKNKKKSKGKITEEDRALLQIYTILNIHREIPLRNDLAGMVYIKQKEFDNMDEEDKKVGNFLVEGKGIMFMSLNDYKTSRKYGSLKIMLSQELRRIVRFHLHFAVNEYLLIRADEKPMSKNLLTQVILREFKKRTGKNISTTMLRKLYLTEKYGTFKEELEKDNTNMAHSMNEALSVYVKEPIEQALEKAKGKNNSEE